MTASFAKLSRIAHWSFWMVERVLVIDAGESATLIVVAERILGSIQVRHHVSIPINLGPPEQLVPETIAQLRLEYDTIRAVLIVPQSETVSQRISLKNESIEDFVAKESGRFREIEGNPPVVDHQSLNEKSEKAYWLTYCQPHVIEQRLKHLGLRLDEIDDVTSAAQGFWGFFETVHNKQGTSYVIDVGRRHSSIMGIKEGKPSFATSFSSPLNIENGPLTHEALTHWFQRLREAPAALHGLPQQTLRFEDQHQVILAGDEALLQPIEEGFTTRTGASPQFARPQAEISSAPGEFNIALGVARASLGPSSLHISLLPNEQRNRRDQRLIWSCLRGWSTAIALTTILLLLVGTWQKFTLFQFKNELLQDTNVAIDKMLNTEKTLIDFADQYERVRPILRFQQETTELIETLAALSQHSQDPSYWLVLLADNDSYTTKTTGKTNESSGLLLSSQSTQLRKKPGFVAEFSFTNEGEAMRAKLTSLVNRLNDTQIYANVDTLPEDVRRPLANTNVVLNNRHVALSLERHRNYFEKQLTLKEDDTTANNEPLVDTETPSTFKKRNDRIPPPQSNP
ncbi:hypothetical protein N8737_03080 [Verrucomicrobia bacterium]|nr:hypothetical protein [Verrucomicrobiota bacterium]MDA7657664.1 hypothetical protein [Verrucomicrobiota bacterium]